MSNIDAKDFLKSLDQYEESVLKGLQKAVEESALLLEREAKLAAPVDTGRLRSSITTEIGKLEATVGTNVEYAAAIEYGSSKHPGSPYLRPALVKAEKNLDKAIQDAIGGK